MSTIREGMILFGHGARDPRWAEPFERLRTQVASRRPEVATLLAYLELMQPDLDTAVDGLVADGCGRVSIVPIFFGVGSHLRRDLPALVDALRARHPAIVIAVADAAGEDQGVLAAVVDYCVRSAATG